MPGIQDAGVLAGSACAGATWRELGGVDIFGCGGWDYSKGVRGLRDGLTFSAALAHFPCDKHKTQHLLLPCSYTCLYCICLLVTALQLTHTADPYSYGLASPHH